MNTGGFTAYSESNESNVSWIRPCRFLRFAMPFDSSSRSASFSWLNTSIAIAIVLGIAFRFYNLGLKVYWFDETMTSLRASGWNQAEWAAAVFKGQPILAGDFVATYQYPDPDLPWQETINALATHPEHSPLYYVAVRLWCAIVPHTVGFVRQLSAWIGLLVLPLTYWLARELFEKPRVAQIATGLAAISPVYVHYAQEAREYSLWTVAIVFASAALLRAIGPYQPLLHPVSWTSRWPWWLAYAAGVALLLYAHPFSAFVLVAHGIYVGVVTQSRHRLQTLMAYIAASLLGVLAFTPWLWVVWQNFSEFLENTQHTNEPLNTPLPLYWGLNLSRIFMDFNQGTSPINPTLYICLGISILALISLWWHERRSTVIFLFALMGVMALGLMVPDIVSGGRRSHNIRYFLPCVIGLQLAVAAWLSRHLVMRRVAAQTLRQWRNGTIALLAVGILSNAVSSQMENWWTKSASKSKHHPQIARVVNAARLGLDLDEPVDRERSRLIRAIATATRAEADGTASTPAQSIALISDEPSGQILSLSHLLHPQITLILTPVGIAPTLPPNYDRVFLYRSSEALHSALATRDQAQFVEYVSWLDELIPPAPPSINQKESLDPLNRDQSQATGASPDRDLVNRRVRV